MVMAICELNDPICTILLTADACEPATNLASTNNLAAHTSCWFKVSQKVITPSALLVALTMFPLRTTREASAAGDTDVTSFQYMEKVFTVLPYVASKIIHLVCGV